MRIRRLVTSLAFILPVVAGTATAQTAFQDVTFQVQAIDNIAFTGAPSLIISAAVAGAAPTAANDVLSTYAITTNQANRKITAAINAAMPTGLTLSAGLEAPTGSTSIGVFPLSTVGMDLVTAISNVNQTNLGVAYKLEATSSASPVASGVRTVTYTITAGA